MSELINYISTTLLGLFNGPEERYASIRDIMRLLTPVDSKLGGHKRVQKHNISTDKVSSAITKLLWFSPGVLPILLEEVYTELPKLYIEENWAPTQILQNVAYLMHLFTNHDQTREPFINSSTVTMFLPFIEETLDRPNINFTFCDRIWSMVANITKEKKHHGQKKDTTHALAVYLCLAGGMYDVLIDYVQLFFKTYSENSLMLCLCIIYNFLNVSNLEAIIANQTRSDIIMKQFENFVENIPLLLNNCLGYDRLVELTLKCYNIFFSHYPNYRNHVLLDARVFNDIKKRSGFSAVDREKVDALVDNIVAFLEK
ncbi:hypothetical protein PCE1_000981 [Barthelona sp. PCE]